MARGIQHHQRPSGDAGPLGRLVTPGTGPLGRRVNIRSRPPHTPTRTTRQPHLKTAIKAAATAHAKPASERAYSPPKSERWTWSPSPWRAAKHRREKPDNARGSALLRRTIRSYPSPRPGSYCPFPAQ